MDAVESGRISEERINQSVQRIWNMKWKTGLLDGNYQPPFEELEQVIGDPQNKNIARTIAQKSITIIKDDNNQLPLMPERIDSMDERRVPFSLFGFDCGWLWILWRF